MVNTHTRAHVAGSGPVPIRSSPGSILEDPDASAEKFTATDEHDEFTIEVAPPLSRREKRKLKKQRDLIDSPAQSNSPISTASSNATPPNDPPKNRTLNRTQPSTSISIPRSLSTMPPPALNHPLLVCSLGNPGPAYKNTLHSTGHYLLTYLHARKPYNSFKLELSGLTARPKSERFDSFHIIKGFQKSSDVEPEDNFVFWQSQTLMNVCGRSVRKAWDKYRREMEGQGREPRLVVLHDELESPLGEVKTRDGSSSARGHNGVKSCQEHLQGVKFWRVTVGIGRPESRDSKVVAEYVLRRMGYKEEKALERAAGPVMGQLRLISEGRIKV
ncbi:peptidyl-tRNA hydrolase [Lindgomyces ingoldianus]|uniref:Peptidyl-tRNA hydrolase n=1 Tax=Lindgomyces ingoldianus TaxID=673940 RepID=A0ACB6R4Y5_9PLEO|nr:peptidyl-tRNA hydrolase [Lindgomyces ingoldianus]KAF2474343.1 peptidyl-tRNA hydrolase [Lindgomyces ingoldianus]